MKSEIWHLYVARTMWVFETCERAVAAAGRTEWVKRMNLRRGVKSKYQRHYSRRWRRAIITTIAGEWYSRDVRGRQVASLVQTYGSTQGASMWENCIRGMILLVVTTVIPIVPSNGLIPYNFRIKESLLL